MNKSMYFFVFYSVLYSSLLLSMDEMPMEEASTEMFLSNMFQHQSIKNKHEEAFNKYVQNKAYGSDVCKQIMFLRGELSHYQRDLRTEENNAIVKIYKTFFPDEQEQKVIGELIDELRDINRKDILPVKSVVRNPDLPKDFISIINKLSIESAINLARLHIESVDKKEKYLLLRTRCAMADCHLGTEDNKKCITIQENDIIPGKLVMNTDFFAKQNPKVKEALCLFILEPIRQEFAVVGEAISLFERLYFQPNYIGDSPEFKSLQELHVRMCTLLPALRSKKEAKLMKYFHKTTQMDTLLDVDDYDLLCKIDCYWRTIAWLEKYCCNPKKS
jgi:hypothetical protein